MKKILFWVLMLCVTAVASATTYSVTISIQKNVEYQKNGQIIGTATESGGSQTITIAADTPYEAEQKALEKCSTMCRQSIAYKESDNALYKGQYCEKWVTEEPYSVTSIITVSN